MTMSMIEEQITELEMLANALRLSALMGECSMSLMEERIKAIDGAIDIIKTLSEKLHAEGMERSCQCYNNGWIPCDERMPEEKPSIFAKYKGTPSWDATMWEKDSDTVLITCIHENGRCYTNVAKTHDGKWVLEPALLKIMRVIAWMPLPKPSQSEEE